MDAAVTSAERDKSAPAAGRPTPPGPTLDQVEQLTQAVRELLMQAKSRHRQMAQHTDQGRLTVLFSLEKTGPMRPSTLAKEIHLDLSTVSRHLRQLEDEGMIAKTTDAGDKRALRVELTAQGSKIMREYMKERVEQVQSALGHWAAQDVTLLTDLLHRFVGDIEGSF